MKFINYRFYLVLGSLIIGILLLEPIFSKIISHIFLLMGLIHISLKRNMNNEAVLWAGFFMCYEVVARMTSGFFFWEFGKYMSILVLLLGLFVEKHEKPLPVYYFLYILLLLIGIGFTDVPFGESARKAIAFNLSGPIQLGIAAIYFYGRKIPLSNLLDNMFYWLLGILPILTFLFFRTPSLSEIVFGGSSNFVTSGGFGPNQVSTMLGFGAFLYGVLLMMKQRITGIKVVDFLILAYLMYRGLLTFSRGGVIAAVLAFMIFSFFYIKSQRNRVLNISRFAIFGSILFIGVWIYTSDITGGMIENRYTNRNARGVLKSNFTSGRDLIFEAQLEGLLENPFFGVGVGSGKYYREDKLDGVVIAAHNEITRLLEEHGLIGIIILVLLFVIPIRSISRQPNLNKAFLFSFLALWFMTINHSAMRLAFPGMMYGLSLLILTKKEKISIEEV